MAGRPPKPKEERRAQFLQIRLTDDELKLLDEASSDASISSWARDVLIRTAKRVMRKKRP